MISTIRTIREKVSGGWLFMIAVIILYGVAAIIHPESAGNALLESGRLGLNILPSFVLVVVLLFLSHIFLDAKRVGRLLGARSGIRGWALSIIAGILSAGPIYMWYPLLADLKEQGMTDGYIATFLYNRAVKLPLLPIMITYFGTPFVVVLMVYMVVFSVANGLIVQAIFKISNRKHL